MLTADRLIVEPYSRPPSLIIYDRTRTDMYRQGKVLQIGTKVEDVEVGDMVIFGLYAGIDWQGNKMIRESDCISKIDKWI